MKNGFWRPLLAAMMLPTLLFGAANDIQISQKNSTDTAWAQRIIAGDAAFTTQAGFKSAIGLGTEDSPTFTGLTLSGLTGVLYGNGASALTVATGAQIKTAAGFPTSSTDNVIPRFDSTAGNLQTSSVLIDDASGNNVTIGGVDANTDLTLRGGLAGATIALGRAATGAIALTAQGTNQNITLTPSGTGSVLLSQVGNTRAILGSVSPAANQGTGLIFNASNTQNGWMIASNLVNVAGGLEILRATTAGGTTFTTTAAAFTTGGSFLLGTPTDSSNGRIQLATHTTSAGGIGFGTDISMFRAGASRFDIVGTTSGDFGAAIQRTGGTAAQWQWYCPSGTNNLVFRGGSGPADALTLDSSQGITTVAAQYVKSTADTSTSITLNSTHYAVTVSNASPITVNLPAGVSGRNLKIKNIGAGTATVDGNGAEQLFSTSAVNTYDLTTGAAVELIWNGTYWAIY